MKISLKRRSFVTYTVGSFLAWALVLTILSFSEKPERMHFIWCVFGGWCICFVSTSIARYIYTPPKKWLEKQER